MLAKPLNRFLHLVLPRPLVQVNRLPTPAVPDIAVENNSYLVVLWLLWNGLVRGGNLVLLPPQFNGAYRLTCLPVKSQAL